MALVSVLVPAHNRSDVLRRALRSVAQQTLTDFECIVVDDCSAEDIAAVVAEFDERFSWVRRSVNGGPTATRMTGLARVRGELVTGLDSDNELFPWALERAAHLLGEHRDADCAMGLYVYPDGLRQRVAGGVKVVGRPEWAAQTSPKAQGDAVGVVRSSVAEEWLQLGRGYYTTEVVFSIQLRLFHSVVLVDEPWGRFHVDAAERTSSSFTDPRRYEDIRRFVREFRPVLGREPCGPVDIALINMLTLLVRARRLRDAAAVAAWMRERGITLPEAVRLKATWALGRRLSPWTRSRPHVF